MKNISEFSQQIDSWDFTMIRFKLSHQEEGEGWDYQTCSIAEKEYKRFLYLIDSFPDERIVPTKLMDTFWHYHILDTRNYISMTKKLFGGYLHHYPYFGLNSDDDKKELLNCFERTKFLYSQLFNEDMVQSNSIAACDSSSSCAGSCYGDK